MAKRWYVIHTYSGLENKVKQALETRIEMMGLHDCIFDIEVPTEEVTELKEGGKRITRERKVMPGYVLVRMILDDRSWSAVKNTAGVTGFVGPEGKPEPLSREEFNKIMRRSTNGGVSHAPRVTTNVSVGQTIRVASGPLKDLDGTVTSVDENSGKVRVNVSIFGRETPVELTFEQIASIE